MTASTSLRAPALVARLSRLDGAWAGDVIGPDGALVGRQQVSCAWDATHLTLRVRSCLLSRAGRVLGAEELQISYDPATDRVAARHHQGQGHTERARATAGAPDEMVLCYDTALQFRRLILPLPDDGAAAESDPWIYRIEVAPAGRLDAEIRVRLHRVEWLARGATSGLSVVGPQ